MPKVTTEQRRWNEEDDASTLARAEEIKTDKLRFLAATKRAASMVTIQTKQLNSIKKIAKKK